MTYKNTLNKSVIEFLDTIKSYYGVTAIDFSKDIAQEDMIKIPKPMLDILRESSPKAAIKRFNEEMKLELDNDENSEDQLYSAEIKAQMENFITAGEKCIASPDDIDIGIELENSTTSVESLVVENSEVPEQVLIDSVAALNIEPEADAQKFKAPEQNILLYNFGPFSDLAEKFSFHIKNLGCDELIASDSLNKIYAKLHEEVSIRPAIYDKSVGLEERMQVLESLRSFINARLEIALKINSHEDDVNINTCTNSLISAEMKKIDIALKAPLSEAGFAESLLSLVGKTFGSNDQKPNVKLHEKRGSDILRNLDSLQDIAIQFKNNAGDQEWERTIGTKLAGEAHSLSKSTHKLVDKMKGTINGGAFNDRYKKITSTFDAANDLISDKNLKAKMAKISNAMKAFLDKLMKILGLGNSRNINVAPEKDNPKQNPPPKSTTSGPSPMKSF